MPNSNAVFVDTSGWIALLNADDHLHMPATQQMRAFGLTRRPLVTTDWVLAETGNGLARTAARAQFVRAARTLSRGGASRVIRVDEEMFRQALGLYEQAADKTWGLIDCASFVAMRAWQILDVLSADRHFQQAGFRCLLPTT